MTEPRTKTPRQKRLPDTGTDIEVGCGTLHVMVTRQDGRIFEVFATIGKGGCCASSQLQALSRSVSLGLRCGIEASEYVTTLKGVHCPQPGVDRINDTHTTSCADAVAQVLAEEIERGQS